MNRKQFLATIIGLVFGFKVVKAGRTATFNNAFVLPAADGTDGQVLITDDSGAYSWGAAGGLNSIADDTTPQLGGNLDAEWKDIAPREVNRLYERLNCRGVEFVPDLPERVFLERRKVMKDAFGSEIQR